MSEEKTGYDRNKDKILGKFFSKTDKRYLNVLAYQYDGGTKKIRISPSNKNTNPNNTDPKKAWVNVPGISGITKEEAQGLVIALQAAIKLLD